MQKDAIEEIRNRKKRMAICYDFDKTLSPDDMQAFTLIPSLEMDKSQFVERFPELSLFYRLFSPLNSEMICIFPYFCPYAESAREIRGIFVALHINNWFSEPILI